MHRHTHPVAYCVVPIVDSVAGHHIMCFGQCDDEACLRLCADCDTRSNVISHPL